MITGTTQTAPVLNDQTLNSINAIYNVVLDRDADPSALLWAQMVLANGGNLAGVMSLVANSAEARSDMASTYAAVASTANLALLVAKPQDSYSIAQGFLGLVANAPTQTEFAAFADAMSTSYGAPIELVSVDPLSGAQTELANTSITNLLAELPVLQAQANGVNLGLQLADGTQAHFASTARLATFLYALAVQQLQATSFVTDNYNLDMQWLNTVDQPLLDEAVFWRERAAAEVSVYPERAVEDNVQANLALRIAAEAPSARQDMSITIHNTQTGNPTQITVFANGGGSAIHDVAPSVFGYIESAVSIALNIAAVVTGQAYLYFAAAAIDAAQAGQDFSNGQDLAGILSLAQAVGAGIGGAAGISAGGSVATTPIATQVINAAAQGVGGVYGVVRSAQSGNAAGLLAGALEAAAAGATGIGMVSSAQTQAMLNAISAALGTAGVATTMASDFASGNLGQGLVDSLNLYLPAVAQAFVNAQSNQSDVQNTVTANVVPNVSRSDLVSSVDPATTSTTSPAGAIGLTETIEGTTKTIYLSPASNATLGIEIVPAATNPLNLISGIDTIDDDLSLLATQIDSVALQTPVKMAFTTVKGVPADAVLYSLNGQTFYAPPNTDFQIVFNTGKGGGSFRDIGQAVGQGGSFDYQRDSGGNFFPEYTKAANLAVGYYMAGAGYSSTSTVVIGEIYAMTHSRNYLSSFFNGGGNANNWVEAIKAANAGCSPRKWGAVIRQREDKGRAAHVFTMEHASKRHTSACFRPLFGRRPCYGLRNLPPPQ